MATANISREAYLQWESHMFRQVIECNENISRQHAHQEGSSYDEALPELAHRSRSVREPYHGRNSTTSDEQDSRLAKLPISANNASKYQFATQQAEGPLPAFLLRAFQDAAQGSSSKLQPYPPSAGPSGTFPSTPAEDDVVAIGAYFASYEEMKTQIQTWHGSSGTKSELVFRRNAQRSGALKPFVVCRYHDDGQSVCCFRIALQPFKDKPGFEITHSVPFHHESCVALTGIATSRKGQGQGHVRQTQLTAIPPPFDTKVFANFQTLREYITRWHGRRYSDSRTLIWRRGSPSAKHRPNARCSPADKGTLKCYFRITFNQLPRATGYRVFSWNPVHSAACDARIGDKQDMLLPNEEHTNGKAGEDVDMASTENGGASSDSRASIISTSARPTGKGSPMQKHMQKYTLKRKSNVVVEIFTRPRKQTASSTKSASITAATSPITSEQRESLSTVPQFPPEGLQELILQKLATSKPAGLDTTGFSASICARFALHGITNVEQLDALEVQEEDFDEICELVCTEQPFEVGDDRRLAAFIAKKRFVERQRRRRSND